MECNLENLINVFNKMSDDGWDINSPSKWGFFFFSNSKETSENIFKEMKDYNYVIEDLYQNDDVWILHVSKTETLKPEKLHGRNIQFNELAEAYNSIYDGWDVSKVDK